MKTEKLKTIPGFVDLQVNGFGGIDFSAENLGAGDLDTVADSLNRAGTAAFLATLITSPLPVYRRNLALIGRALESPALHGRILGIHLEGPFLSPRKGYIGSHDPQHVLLPDVRLLQELWEISGGTIRLLTMAAELPGAAELAHRARELNIAVSIGHSAFDEQSLDTLVACGATAITHLGNGLPNLIPRHHNPLWPGLANDAVSATIIADGFHLPPALLKTILAVKGVSRTIVVSDLAPIAGLPAGNYRFAGQQVVLEPTGRIVNPKHKCLAGTGTTLLQAVNYLASLDLVSPADLVKLAFDNPLRLLGLQPQDLHPTCRLCFTDGSFRIFST